jgi:hypothetical protein
VKALMQTPVKCRYPERFIARSKVLVPCVLWQCFSAGTSKKSKKKFQITRYLIGRIKKAVCLK